MIKIFFTVFFFVFSFSFPLKAQNKINFQDLTIIVSSCDKYADLWEGFFTLLFKHWPELKEKDLSVPIMLITNKKTYSDSRVINVQTSKDQSWSDNMLEALSQVKTKYVLILLEDYFITFFDRTRLYELYEIFLKDPKTVFMQISAPDKRYITGKNYSELTSVKFMGKYDPYRLNLQACIMEKNTFVHLIKPGESPWQYEIEGSTRSAGMQKNLLCVVEKLPIEYLNMAHGGYLNFEAANLIQKEGIKLENTKLPFDKDHRFYLFFKRQFLPYIYHHIYNPFISFLRNL